MTLQRDSRVVSVEDYARLLSFYAVQSHAIDEGDAERWADSFTPDGAFDSPTYEVPVTGRENLIAFARSISVANEGRTQRHHLNSLIAEHRGSDVISAQAYILIVVTQPTQPPVVARSVKIDDDLRLTQNGWRIARRITHVDGL